MIGIYKILNIKTHTTYIGSSLNIGTRIKKHKSMLAYNRHPNKHLQNSYNKHGKRLFKFEILEKSTSNKLIQKEQRWLNQYVSKKLPVFNIRGQVDRNIGFHHSNKAKQV